MQGKQQIQVKFQKKKCALSRARTENGFFSCLHPNLECPQDGAFAFDDGQDVICESLVTFTDNVMGERNISGRAVRLSVAREGDTLR